MQHVEATQWLPYSPQVIYEFLTDPASLVKVVGRIAQARVVERGDNHGKLAVKLDMPANQVIDTIGEVDGSPYEHLTFKTAEPFPLEFSWQLSAQTQADQAGTEVRSALGFDLSVFGLPLGGIMIRGIVLAEIQDDLKRLAQALEAHHKPKP
jgi:ribosome-associated toxin RatA of RatAB toxin-antitoxin module